MTVETRQRETTVKVTEVQIESPWLQTSEQWFAVELVWEVLQALALATEADPVMIEHRSLYLALKHNRVIHSKVLGAAQVHWPDEGFQPLVKSLRSYAPRRARMALPYKEWKASLR